MFSNRNDNLGSSQNGSMTRAAGVRPAWTVFMRALGTLFMLLLLATGQGIAASNGDKFINRATFNALEYPPTVSQVTVTVATCAPARIEFMKYAPGADGATVYAVGNTAYQNSAGSFSEVPAPLQFETKSAINLTSVPLLLSTLFHAGEPLFIRVIAPGQNSNPLLADTITIDVTDPMTGDNETLKLTETAPDSGTFIAYIQTVSGTGSNNSNNGSMTVVEASYINADFHDNCSGAKISADAALVDPYGLVFETVTGKPVDGARVELLDAATRKAAVVYGDNGKSSNIYPSSIISGGTATDTEGTLYSFPQGSYRFPYVKPGQYILKVTPPSNLKSPSKVATADIQKLPGAPFTILEPGSRGEPFMVPVGPALRVDLPVDPKTGTLWIKKSAGKSIISAGEFLTYELVLENNDAFRTITSARVTDILPPGFRYQPGSTRIDGKPATDPQLLAGNVMIYTVGPLAAKASLTIKYTVAVGAGARPGSAINTATALTTPAMHVNTATAKVQVQEPFMMSRSIIMGRVFVGTCSDNPEDNRKGMEGIGIYLEDGTFVFSDKFGMFHFEGVKPGAHVVQLDLDSIPAGYRIQQCEQNSRFAGRAYSQFVDTQGGTLWRTDFYLGKIEPAAAEAPKAAAVQPVAAAAETAAPSAPAMPQKGVVSLELISSQSDAIIDYRLPLRAQTVPLKKLRLTVALPEGASYQPGSSSFNGAPLPDPESTPDGLLFPLEDTTADWRGELQFRAVVDKGRQSGELVTKALLVFDTASAAAVKTPEMTNILLLTRAEQTAPLPLIVLRPHFPTFGAELDDADRQELDRLAAQLSDKVIVRIDVTGHTDNVRIAPRSRGIYSDNSALSLARARSVGRYLTAALHLPPDALYVNGSGEQDPVASNKNAAGRALNRRVEVRITTLQRIGTADLKLVKERSGMEKIETSGAPLPPAETPRQSVPGDTGQPVAATTGATAAAAAISKQSPAEVQPLPGKQENIPAKAAAVTLPEERVELFSVINEGIVNYRVKLKGIGQPLGKVTVRLTMPKSLLYMNGTSRLTNSATADPEISGAVLTYNLAGLDSLKRFDLKLQALFDNEDKSDETISRVTVELADEAGKTLKTFQSSANLSDDMDEIVKPDIAPQESAADSENRNAYRDDTELYQEKVAKSAGETAVSAPSADAKLHVSEEEGILYPADRSVIVSRINAVRIVMASALKPVLLLDGKEIPADRIGFSLKDRETGKSLYTYIGVDFGEPGEHTLRLKGLDEFGLTRFDKSAAISMSGDIASIRLVAADGNVANGKTPVRIRVQLFDKDDKPIMANAELALRGSELRPLQLDGIISRNTPSGLVTVSPEGWISFQPVTASGLYRLQLAYNKVLCDVETYVKPQLRDWILVGIAEGTAGYNTLSGHMENLKAAGVDEHLYDRERLALFAKGTIKGEWLLTMAYDSAKKSTGVTDNALFQTIDPNSYYTLYGDATAQGYEAATQRRLYLKIERDQFYALFGDFDSGLTVTELSRYSRRMNGLKSEYRSKDLEITAFVAETAQSFVKDELRGDGTSGLYRLTRKGIVLNSEKVTIESRDRFRSEIVTDSRAMNRFVDYSIDYDNGTIFFKSPVPSRDEQLNPVYIVVDYETSSAGRDALTFGGRAGATLLDGKLKSGASYVHEGHVSGESNLYGLDATLQLGQGTKARAEIATTSNDINAVRNNGNAYLVEVTHNSRNLDGKAYYREQESDFGLGQQKASEAGTRKFGVEGMYKLDQIFSVGGQAYRQYNLADGAMRDLVESSLIYTDKQFSAKTGLRYAGDSLADGSTAESLQATVGGSWKTFNQRLTLRADHEQSLFSKNLNSDFPTRTILGADFQATKETLLFAQEELTYGNAANTNTTRVGVKNTPWKGGAIASSIINEMKENNDRTLSTVGLSQKWQLNPLWTIDGGLDHTQTIRKSNGYQFNAKVPAASGGDDFTAVSLGANFMERKLTWSNRVEYRNSDSEDKWGLISGVINEQGLDWGWTTRLQLFHTQSSGGRSKTDADLRLGLAYRPPVSRWIVLDRLDLLATDDKSVATSQKGKRIINNLNANYRPDQKTQISLQYGAKYVLESLDELDYSGYTDLIGIEGRYDLTKEWDIGLRTSMLHSWQSSQISYGLGPSIGFNVMENAWISLGYNIFGFQDKDFSAASYTAQGPYVQFRFKFDQNTVKDGLKALNQ